MACDPQTLQNQANCLLSCLTLPQMAAAELAVLCQINNNDPCDPQALANQSNCILSCLGAAQIEAAQLNQLCAIANT